MKIVKIIEKAFENVLLFAIALPLGRCSKKQNRHSHALRRSLFFVLRAERGDAIFIGLQHLSCGAACDPQNVLQNAFSQNRFFQDPLCETHSFAKVDNKTNEISTLLNFCLLLLLKRSCNNNQHTEHNKQKQTTTQHNNSAQNRSKRSHNEFTNRFIKQNL